MSDIGLRDQIIRVRVRNAPSAGLLCNLDKWVHVAKTSPCEKESVYD